MPTALHLFRGSREVMLSRPWQAPVEHLTSEEAVTCCRFDPTGLDFTGADGRVLRAVVAHIVLGRREREVWERLQGTEERRTEWLLARVAGKEAVRLLVQGCSTMDVWPADVEIFPDSQGRLLAEGEWTRRIGWSPYISMAHSQGTAVALAANGTRNRGLGIHVEHFAPTSKGFESPGFSAGERALLASLRSSDHREAEWALRVWCAKKAMAKALGRRLPGGARELIVQDVDSKLGSVTLETGGSLASAFPSLSGKRLVAHSLRDGEFVYAGAALWAEP
jgi:phosphopantetheinyl transferase